jgi:hypothetical protein
LYRSDRGDAVGRYSVPGETSFISRFTLKFVEIVAAGVATAVSGYIVAHLSGFFPGPAPTAVQVPTVQAAPSVNAANNPNAQPITPVSIDSDARRLAPQPDLKPAAIPPVRATADVAPARKPMAVEKPIPLEKPVAAETSQPETKPHDAAETKPRSAESFEAQVRAALAKGESAKPVPVVPSHQAAIPADLPHAPPAAETQPRQTDPATGAIPVTPRAADAAPPQAPVLAEPPAAVDVKSLPVAGVDSAPAPEPAQQAQAEAQPVGNDFFSAIKHIPDFLSPESHQQVPADKAPRPPMPVGQ